MSLEIGQIIEGKYRIVRLIGEGGMGAVYEGENVRIKRRVAIKVLHAATATNAEAVQRFEREAQAAGRIGSDHILEVLDLGTLTNNDRFMVMEYLDGEPLSARIQRRVRLAPRELVPLARQMLAGLAAAHSAGIIHRDLKPDNIYILREKAGQADYVKIIDFGISKFQAMSGDVMNMTRTGTVMGTPYYMSPEQANGSREADARSDLYAVGVIMYEAITGQVPFDAKSFNELLFKIVLSTPPSPLTIVPDLDVAFCSIVSKGMARDVEHRFQTALQFAEAIDTWARTGAPVTVPPEHRQAAAAAAAQGAQNLAASAQNLGASAIKGAPMPSVDVPHFAASGVTVPKQSAQSWATSQPDVAAGVPRASKGPVVAIAILGALLVLGGGAFAGFKLVGGSSKTETTQAVITAAATAPPKAPVADPPKPAAESPPAETKPSEAKPNDTAPSAAPAQPKIEPRAVAPIAPKSRPLAPPPAPRPGPAAKSPKQGTPDFGY
jgi:tRNA A-37 threonylcarbamoyl transferase component Bud32